MDDEVEPPTKGRQRLPQSTHGRDNQESLMGGYHPNWSTPGSPLAEKQSLGCASALTLLPSSRLRVMPRSMSPCGANENDGAPVGDSKSSYTAPGDCEVGTRESGVRTIAGLQTHPLVGDWSGGPGTLPERHNSNRHFLPHHVPQSRAPCSHLGAAAPFRTSTTG